MPNFVIENIISNLSFQAKMWKIFKENGQMRGPHIIKMIWGIHVCSLRFSTINTSLTNMDSPFSCIPHKNRKKYQRRKKPS